MKDGAFVVGKSYRPRPFRQRAGKCILATLLVALFGAASIGAVSAEEGCPSGLLPSSVADKTCTKLSKHTELPFDVSKPMVFEAMQISMTAIFVQAIGTITPDTPQQFQRFLKSGDAKLTKLLYFHSAGGDFIAGMKLGEMIRKARYNTGIGRSMPLDGIMDYYEYDNAACTSACAYAFMGGVTRSYGKTEMYGLPRLGAPGTDAVSGADPQAVSDILAKYIKRMGANPQILQAAARAPAEVTIFRVPVALGVTMKIIHDTSGETTFRIESVGGRATAKFDFTIAEKRFSGQLQCVGGSNTLTIIDRDDTIPAALHQIKGATATFLDGTGKQLEGSASYVGAGHRAMVFTIPEIAAVSFSGRGLRLDGISNPHARGDLVEDMIWIDNVRASSFSIVASNGTEALPPVLLECAKK